MPVFVEASILALEKICINGGKRGYLVGLDPRLLSTLVEAKPVHCAL
jgi:prolyl-tRNA editing enzyme YbaK/EbsC (Cys-tRNA(Pro) deacylase)